jgi:hypothetical protein
MSYEIHKAPLAEAIAGLVGKMPPFELDGIWCWKDVPDHITDDLQDWCSLAVESNPYIAWAPGYGVIDAAELLLKLAIENANLQPERNPFEKITSQQG